jgi:IS5 family transposase
VTGWHERGGKWPAIRAGERTRPSVSLERILRFTFCGNVALADQVMEAAFCDSWAMPGFAGIDLAVDTVPDETTILDFRHWLERHDPAQGLFDEVGAMLKKRGLLMRQGTIVDATIIAVLPPPGTKKRRAIVRRDLTTEYGNSNRRLEIPISARYQRQP